MNRFLPGFPLARPKDQIPGRKTWSYSTTYEALGWNHDIGVGVEIEVEVDVGGGESGGVDVDVDLGARDLYWMEVRDGGGGRGGWNCREGDEGC